MTVLGVLTLVLVLGLTLRLSRLIIVDDVGLWFVRGPAAAWAWGHDKDKRGTGAIPWRSHLVTGLSCPFCVGFWIGCLVVLSLYLVGGPDSTSTAASWWRWIAGAFTLNWTVGHIAARVGDVDNDEE